MRLEDLMERAAQYDENLARDIKDYLDMKDAETRSVISTASDAYECFAKCGKKYMDGPLSKSKDGYRKK